MNPLRALENALARREGDRVLGPDQRVSLETMIDAYTIHGAYLQHQDDRVGSLEVGKEADLVVLARDLFDLPVDEIGEVEILATFVAGVETHRSPDFDR